MNIISIVNSVGGAGEAAKMVDVPRQTIETWIKRGKYPRWREADVKRLAAIAERRTRITSQPRGDK